MRGRGIETVVLGGVATNFGVDSTAREAWQHGYDVVLAEDLTTSTDAALHDMAVRHILPRLSRIRQAADIRLRSV